MLLSRDAKGDDFPSDSPDNNSMTSNDALPTLAWGFDLVALVLFGVAFFGALVFFFGADCFADTFRETFRFFVVSHSPAEAAAFRPCTCFAAAVRFGLFGADCFGNETITWGFGDCNRH